MNLSLSLLVFLTLSMVVFSYTYANNHCSIIFMKEAPISPLENTIAQLETRLIKFNELLNISDPITQRQGLKIIHNLGKVIERFQRTRELNDSDFEKILTQTQDLEAFESKLAELAQAQLLDPLRLRRFLWTAETIDPQFIYYAHNLPGFGEVQFHFSKDAADFLSQPGLPRDIIFPKIFRGKVGPKAQGGIKKLTDQEAYDDSGKLWEVYELKRMGNGMRVIIIYSEGHLHFYRVLKNHGRVNYLSKENILKDFFTNNGLIKSQNSNE